MGKKIIIVGGVAGGASAAARLRRLDEEAEIVLFERDQYISFANCGLPYYIGNNITEREKLLVQTPTAMKKRFNIDVRVHSEVTKIDPANKMVTVQTKERGTYQENYDYLILSPGAKAIKPKIPGIDHPQIFTLRNVADTDRIKKQVAQAGLQSAVVIGGGFVGVEMAENLRELGMAVTLVEAAPHILAPFDSDMVTIAEAKMQEKGVQLILEDGVKAFADRNNQVEVTLNSGRTFTSDMVILAIGVTPDTAFVKDSGINLGPKGHIIVNEHLQTNIENIYAVGDAVEVTDYISGQKTAIPLAGPANKQGRIAADNVGGFKAKYKGTQGTSIIKVFDLTCAATGNNERTLQRLNIPYQVIYIHPQSHASYYPGSTMISLKLIFNDEGRVLGAQAFGYKGVDKRIDTIATIIRLKGTVYDLTEMEHAYAPPFSSAKDPVNMAGFVAENVLSGKMDIFVPRDIENMNRENSILLDVRSEKEYQGGHIDGALNIPIDELRSRLDELEKSKEIWVYCKVGLRGYIAARILSQKGFKVKNMTGGYISYKQARFKPQ